MGREDLRGRNVIAAQERQRRGHVASRMLALVHGAQQLGDDAVRFGEASTIIPADPIGGFVGADRPRCRTIFPIADPRYTCRLEQIGRGEITMDATDFHALADRRIDLPKKGRRQPVPPPDEPLPPGKTLELAAADEAGACGQLGDNRQDSRPVTAERNDPPGPRAG